MTGKHMTLPGRILRGAMAGLAGTLAMDLLWYRRYRKGGGVDGFRDWEFSTGVESYDEAAAPAQVGKRLFETAFDIELSPDTAGPMNNAVHWATGAMWGATHGVLTRFVPLGPALGPGTGTLAWLTSYAVLAPAGLYQPINEYDWKTLWKDWSAHLVFGTVTGVVFCLIGARTAGRTASRPSSSQ